MHRYKPTNDNWSWQKKKLKEFNAQNVDGTEAGVATRIAELRGEIESLKITIEETEARINTITTQLGNESQYQQTKGEIDELRQRRQGLVNQLEQLLLVYQEGYPDVISLRAQIAELDTAIHMAQASGGDVYTGRGEAVENPLYEELRRQLSVAKVDLRGQKRRMESLIHLSEQEHERAQRVAANQAQLSELTRDYNVTRDVYEEMLQRKESARLSMTLDIEGQGNQLSHSGTGDLSVKTIWLAFYSFRYYRTHPRIVGTHWFAGVVCHGRSAFPFSARLAAATARRYRANRHYSALPHTAERTSAEKRCGDIVLSVSVGDGRVCQFCQLLAFTRS
jgi:chromosome segregation ATPase